MAAPRTSPRRTGQPAALSAADGPVRLWDPVVRLTHWGVALAVLFNALVSEGGSLWHVSLGWLVMALLVLRLVWGALGPAEARFSAFPPNPVAALRHLQKLLAGQVREAPSHNPAGAMMAYAFWAVLAVVVATGLVMTGGATPMQIAEDKAAVASGDWSALIAKDQASDEDAEDDGSALAGLGETAEEVHELAANLLLLLAALHVLGVIVESRALRRNLVRPMLLGDRRR